MTGLRIVDDPVARLHSVRSERLPSFPSFPSIAAGSDAVVATIATLERRLSAREDVAVDLVEVIHEHFRDGVDVVELRVEGLTRAEWDEKPGDHINGWTKRQVFRSPTGGLLASIQWETDEDIWGGRTA